MSRKCSMLDLVESRFFSSVMLMVRIVLPFDVVLSFYLLLYTVWRWGANLFRYFLLSIFRVRQTEAAGVAIIATAVTFAINGGGLVRDTRQNHDPACRLVITGSEQPPQGRAAARCYMRTG